MCLTCMISLSSRISLFIDLIASNALRYPLDRPTSFSWSYIFFKRVSYRQRNSLRGWEKVRLDGLEANYPRSSSQYFLSSLSSSERVCAWVSPSYSSSSAHIPYIPLARLAVSYPTICFLGRLSSRSIALSALGYRYRFEISPLLEVDAFADLYSSASSDSAD
jgi:hypothetical protein